MGFIFGFIKRLIKLLITLGLCLALFVAVILLIPNLPPYTKFSSIQLEPSLPRIGALAPNGALNNVEKLYKDKLLGPEAFQVYNGEVYTSLATGEIVKVSSGGQVHFVTKIGEPCTGLTQPHKCGRPLGFEIDEKTKQMYVPDAYYGIWKVDLNTGKKQLLVSPRVAINGRQPKMFNALTLAKNGDFYWTDSSSDFDLRNGAYIMLSDPSGRLFHYNAAKNQSRVLLDDLWMANGVALSPDNQFVLVAESTRLRVMKYYLDGPKKGKSEVFVAGLPGVPDNMRALPDGSGVLVALYTVFDDEHPLIARSMGETPLVRKFLARVHRFVEIPFEFLNEQYPNIVFENIVHHIGSFEGVSGFLPGLSGLLQLDWNGNIVASYYNTDGTNPLISDAIVYNDKLYMGSPHRQNYIASVAAPPLLKKAFAGTKSSPSPKAAETVTKEVPKPKAEQPNPKVEEKKEAPKTAKPVAQEPPKAQPKPAEPVKKTTPKPVETKPTTEPKAAPTPKPPPPKQAESKPSTPKQPETRTAPPPKETKSAPPKQNEPKTTPMPKAETKPAAKPTQTPPVDTKKTRPTPEKQVKDKPVPEQIPIKEEIPSDTVKPSKETLKVIKKSGPTEIPNPSL